MLRRALLIACLTVPVGITAQATPRPGDVAHAQLVRNLKAELRRLAALQAERHAATNAWAATAVDLRYELGFDRRITMRTVPGRGWSATLSSDEEPALTCGIYEGAPALAPNGAVIEVRVPACWRALGDGTYSSE